MKHRYQGKVFGWFETGLEGTVWALQCEGQPGYDGLVRIEAGDYLEIFSPERKLLFKGIIEPDYEKGKQDYADGMTSQPVSLGFWVHWIQKDYEPDDWGMFFMSEENSGLLIRNQSGNQNQVVMDTDIGVRVVKSDRCNDMVIVTHIPSGLTVEVDYYSTQYQCYQAALKQLKMEMLERGLP